MTAERVPDSRTEDEATAQIFLEHRDLLVAVAQSMLGDWAEAESVVQEIWRDWTSAAGRPDALPVADLVRATTHTAIARLRRAESNGERYLGAWVPDPLLGEPDLRLAESLSVAMMVVLDALPPEERAVFVLRDGFGLSDTDVAALLKLPESSVRTMGRHTGISRSSTWSAERDPLVQRFVDSCSNRDGPALRDLLAADVTLTSDMERLSGAPLRVEGREKVAEFLFAFLSGAPLLALYHALRGDGLIVLWAKETSPIGAVVLQMSDDRVKEIDFVGQGT